jgi:uncharacterized protein DUF4129
VGPRRAVPLVLAVAGLLAVAALSSRVSPLTGSRGTGPTPRFFDYVFTTAALFAVFIVVVYLWSVLGAKFNRTPRNPTISLMQFFVTLAASVLVGVLLLHARLHWPALKSKAGQGAQQGRSVHSRGANGTVRRAARLRWDEVAIVAALLAAAGVATFAASRSSKPVKEWRFRSHEEIALALDESLDDLRREPDLRRAIIAAYARMERAFAAAGIPRRPSEAPLEFLSRALAGVEASAAGVRRLTDLFEWAKFSPHEPDEAMRDEAIAALEDLRDELRAPAQTAA